MKKTTKKLRDQIISELTPLAGQLRVEGLSDAEIGHVLRRHQDCKIKDFYNSQKYGIGSINESIYECLDKQKADSKIEKVFYDSLVCQEIPFSFQTAIGPYRVDYLIGGLIVFEGDGPQHKASMDNDKIRDQYLEDMGYVVFRMRWELVAMVCDAVIDEIRAVLIDNDIIVA